MYDVNKYIIKPETEEKQCSYVELVAPEDARAQTPTWFVSHWWGEPVMDFIACVEEHAKVRRLDPEEAVYWVCALVGKIHVLVIYSSVHVMHVNFTFLYVGIS